MQYIQNQYYTFSTKEKDAESGYSDFGASHIIAVSQTILRQSGCKPVSLQDF